MNSKWVDNLYQLECAIFLSLNKSFERSKLNLFFRIVTHLGGASMTVGITLILIIMLKTPYQLWAIQSATSLLASHLIVVLFKKIYPRNRPYLTVQDARVVENPLKDYSFPSGHTTAIFSIVTPYVIHLPLIGIILYPIACCVGLSRICLGLHYPSDVLVGSLVGSLFGILVVLLSV
ncbi:phosphatase PAP2 family protein [Bacillus sp. BGMRC 2118]|nr:phosphatase PAP2 family protein [Bacillus sp. BGMRC 2118]